MKLFKVFILLVFILSSTVADENRKKRLAYLVSDINIPFWSIMAKGIKYEANQRGYEIDIYSASNIKKNEMLNTANAIKNSVDGLIISPINSSTAVTIIKLAKKSNIPVVVSDIGSDSQDYVSYISSNNYDGAYNIGKILVKKMKKLGIDKTGTVGIIAIPQKRANGKARTSGFLRALNQANIKGAGIKQQVDFSYQETYNHSLELIKKNPDLKALWLQGSDKYKGALDAIYDTGKKDDILLLCFDAEPIFLELIPKDILVASAMQQPYLMGQKAAESMDKHLNGKYVKKEQQLEILAISKDNIEEKLPIIKKNVLGVDNE
jgi:ribose transport system substrate-binding protein